MTLSVVYSEYGDPEVLRLVETEEPKPGPGQVRIGVRAAGVNPIDGKFRSGAMSALRPIELPATPGLEVSGVIESVGEGVTAWQPGDEVMAQVTGGYATQVVAPAATVGRKPPGMSWEEAAALPVGVDTVLRVLSELEVISGETLLLRILRPQLLHRGYAESPAPVRRRQAAAARVAVVAVRRGGRSPSPERRGPPARQDRPRALSRPV